MNEGDGARRGTNVKARWMCKREIVCLSAEKHLVIYVAGNYQRV